MPPSQTSRLHNAQGEEIELWLEPWGEVLPMPPDATFTIVTEGDAIDAVEFELKNRVYTVFAPEGTVLHVHDENDNELTKGFAAATVRFRLGLLPAAKPAPAPKAAKPPKAKLGKTRVLTPSTSH